MANPIPVQALEVFDFAGGITDNYIGGDKNQYEKADNFIINDNRKLDTRPGSEVYDSSNAQIPAGAQRIHHLVEHEDQLFQQSARNVYFINSGWNTLTGPDGNPAIGAGTASDFYSYTLWNKHLFWSSDQFSNIMKQYKDSGGTWQARNLGLPRITLPGAIELANDLKSQYNSHIADTGAHTNGADSTNVVSASNAHNFETLVTLVDDLMSNYDAHDDDAELSSSWSYHAAQEASDHSLSSTDSPKTLTEVLERLDDFKTKFNAHDNDGTAHGTSGGNQSSEFHTPQITPGADTGKSFIYAFVLTYEYKIGTVTFQDAGPTKLVEVTNADAPDSNANSISDIPELVSGSTENYDTGVIKVEIYRTTNGGSVLFKAGEVTNATTSFTDDMSDSTLQDQEKLYTEGNVLDNDPPPPAKYIHSVNDILWLGYVKEGTQERGNRLRMSKKNKPYGCPESWAIDFDSDIIGIGSVNIYPVVFCEEGHIYRVEGYFDLKGRGVVRKREISRTVTLANHRSIVQTKDGLYFAATDGFYFTDGYRISKLSKQIPDTYDGIVGSTTQRNRIYGTYDKELNRVYWACQQDSSSSDNDTIFTAHLEHPRPDGDMPLTTWSGGNDSDNFQPSCIYFDSNNNLLRADRRGYLLEHTDGDSTDPKIDTAISAANWGTTTIIFDYRSCAYDFGTINRRKWVTKFVLSADNIAGVSIVPSSNNDNTGVFEDLKAIQETGDISWGDPTIEWGDESLRWNYVPTVDAWRWFPASGGLRCVYKQIKITNAYIEIDTSTSIGNATINSGPKTIDLDDYPTEKWLTNAENYYISFADDSYDTEFLITDRTDQTLTVSDGAGELSDGSDVAWKIKGYKKNDLLSILSYTIQFSYLTTTQDPFRSAS